MSIDLEQRLRASLHRQAAGSLPISPDPWAAFSTRRRRHQIIRRRRQVVIGIASAGLVAAIGVGVIPVPSIVPTFSTGPAHKPAVPNDEPTVGSLAGNTVWLNELRAQLPRITDSEPPWQLVDPSDVRIRFAGDVPGGRIALVTFTVQRGTVDQKVGESWLTGPVNATPQQMSAVSIGPRSSDVLTREVGGGNKPGYLVVVAPHGSVINTSLSAEFGADGRVHRTWTPGNSAQGLAVVTVPPLSRLPASWVKVTKDGKTLFNNPPVNRSDDHHGKWPVREALKSARGIKAAFGQANDWVANVTNDASLDAATTRLRIPWIGMIHGKRTALIQLTPPGGGSLFYAYPGIDGAGGFDLRLLVPAKGAETRPIAWRLRADVKDLGAWGNHPPATTAVAVVTAPGTARAEMISKKGTTPLTLDKTGYAEAQLPANEQATIRAYDVAGKLLGETAVPDPDTTAREHVPGEDRATRLVD